MKNICLIISLLVSGKTLSNTIDREELFGKYVLKMFGTKYVAELTIFRWHLSLQGCIRY